MILNNFFRIFLKTILIGINIFSLIFLALSIVIQIKSGQMLPYLLLFLLVTILSTIGLSNLKQKNNDPISQKNYFWIFSYLLTYLIIIACLFINSYLSLDIAKVEMAGMIFYITLPLLIFTYIIIAIKIHNSNNIKFLKLTNFTATFIIISLSVELIFSTVNNFKLENILFNLLIHAGPNILLNHYFIKLCNKKLDGIYK